MSVLRLMANNLINTLSLKMSDIISQSVAAVQFKHHRPEYKGLFSMDNRERGFHVRVVHLTQDTSRKRKIREINQTPKY